MDVRVFGIALALSAAVALLVAAASMLRLRSAGFADPLRQGRHESAGARSVHLRNALSVAQLAMAVVLMLSGGLIVRSVRRVQRVNLGYDADHVIGFLLFPPSPQYDRAADAAALYQRAIEALRAIPGVESVALVNRAPPGPFVTTRIVVPGRGAETAAADVASYRTVSPGYLRTLRLTTLEGRWFTEDDMRAPNDGIVVSESVARRYWPGRDPTGEPLTIFGAQQRRPDFGQAQPSHVIGVVSDVRFLDGAGPLPVADVYVPFTRLTWPAVNVLVRTAGDPAVVIPALKRAVLSVDPAIPVSGSAAGGGPAELDRGLTNALLTRRYLMRLLGAFAGSAFVLALVGVYGVVAYGVTQRRHEFGVRMALGAAPADVFTMVLRQGSWLAVAGVGTGISGGLALTRLLTAFLYDTSPTDATTFALVSVAVGATVIGACAVPARRAARLDPVAALRDE